ncbi:MAG: cobyrinate a,c-diamide synthase [Pseudomonadota bacterium]
MVVNCSRIALSALRGNAGKTFLTVGIAACLRKAGKAISPFKKGPDYIDAAWLSLAADLPCYNLDVFLMGREGLLSSFLAHTKKTHGALVEGNRGLFDGMDAQGSYSTAELAKILDIPVVLIVDCSMATRTVAAMVLGCQNFDTQVDIKGVILNRISGKRHESIVRTAIEEKCGVPILGAVPKIKGGTFPERHMGLVPPQEHPEARKAVDEAARNVELYVDVERIWEIAVNASPLNCNDPLEEGKENALFLNSSKRPRIGVIKDSAFWFYYPDNLEVLEKLGAEIVECSALFQDELPPIDALYIGGGFPETHAEKLAANEGFKRSMHEAVERGLPVYAECGGLMYLGKQLIVENKTFPMVGVFPLTFVLQGKPEGHGYTVLEVDQPNPYFEIGETLFGHEFHYSKILDEEKDRLTPVFKIKRGHGIDGRRDGLCYKNVLATYSHLHALGTDKWARGLFEQAVFYSQKHNKNIEDISFCGRQSPVALNF